MKLLHCTECGDIVRVYPRVRACMCGGSEARYVDNKLVHFSGPARILVIPNNEFAESRPGPPKPGKAGFGPEYRWWVVGEHFDKAIKRVDRVEEGRLPAGQGGQIPFVGGDVFPRGEAAELHFEQTLYADMESGRSLCMPADPVEDLSEVGDVPDQGDPWLDMGDPHDV